MSRYLICLSYDGTEFHGWQIQPQERTVQAVLESIISEIAGIHLTVTGSGRTDAGVHAQCQYAHFDLKTRMTCPQIIAALNSKVPSDILIKDCRKVPDDFSARYDAISRTYQYHIALQYSPFNRNYAVYLPRFNFTEESMADCLSWFIGEHDFTAFARFNPDLNHHRCTINSFVLHKEDDQLVFTIQANRFLHNMVRRIVGTCLRISHTNSDPAIITKLINDCDPTNNLIYTAPPQGLFLTNVEYNLTPPS